MGLAVLSCLVLCCSLSGIMSPVSAKKPDPWLLNIEFYDHGNASNCLGVLISRQHVMSLCSQRKDSARIKSLDGVVLLNIETIATYYLLADTDIIIIDLGEEIKVGSNIHPVCIAPSDVPYSRAMMSRETRSGTNLVERSILLEAGDMEDCPKKADTLCAICGEDFTVQYAGDPIVFIQDNVNKVYLLAFDTGKSECNSATRMLQYSRISKNAAWIQSITGVTPEEDCKFDWNKES